jgi:hypothetical protein
MACRSAISVMEVLDVLCLCFFFFFRIGLSRQIGFDHVKRIGTIFEEQKAQLVESLCESDSLGATRVLFGSKTPAPFSFQNPAFSNRIQYR